MMALSALRAVTLCAIIQSALAEEPAEPLVEESLPPGPMEVPGLGSLDFLWNHYAMNMPLPDLLQEYRLKYGNLFTIKTGPVRQVWVSGPLADTILSRPEAAGRPTLSTSPFGEDFLFLVRQPERAAPIRKEQHVQRAS